MNILISQLGVADPIQNNRDASMLHIYRHYPIQQVILLDTGATKYKQKDYLKALNSVRPLSAGDLELRSFRTINPASYADCQNVILKTLIKSLKKYQGQGVKVFLNATSGTSALTSCVYAVSQLFNNVTAIEVQKETRAENKRTEEPTIADLIDSNLDARPNQPNRCKEVPKSSLMLPLANAFNAATVKAPKQDKQDKQDKQAKQGKQDKQDKQAKQSKVLPAVKDTAILVEGPSDVDYIKLILKQYKSKTLVFPCGGCSNAIDAYEVLKEAYSEVFVVLDGDVSAGERAKLTKVAGNNTHFLRKQAIEAYFSWSDIKDKSGKEKKATAKKATYKDVQQLEKELLPVFKRWGILPK
ncbi:MAG: hypothetical protein LBG97_07980 [Coriobacteriales bacterium]|jgi:5S rRNA maturation endonuclease (ribonuclease M5)|nr:hypothetical protein [Coriobacteriales bacterium]